MANRKWQMLLFLPTLLLRPSPRPHRSLVHLCHRRKPFIHELLQAPALVGLGSVDVALRIGGDAVHSVELTRLPPAVAEARQDFERITLDDVHLLIAAVGEVDVLLLRIL